MKNFKFIFSREDSDSTSTRFIEAKTIEDAYKEADLILDGSFYDYWEFIQ